MHNPRSSVRCSRLGLTWVNVAWVAAWSQVKRALTTRSGCCCSVFAGWVAWLAVPAGVGVEGGGAEGFEPVEEFADPPVVVDPGLVVAVLVGGELPADGFRRDLAGPLPVGAVQAGRDVNGLSVPSEAGEADRGVRAAGAVREVRGFDKPPYFVPAGEHGDEGPNLEERRLLAAGTVTYRVVYDQEAVAIPGRLDNIRDGIRSGERARVAASLPVKLVLCDDTMAVLCSPADYRNAVAYLIRPSSLLDMASGLFEAVWDRAVAVGRAGSTAAAPLPEGRDQQLISLLASGATDAMIARAFGWSTRTVQRHIHELMEEAGARTRFQLGMEAVNRGWV
jgi:DNA-binding CsgD family transcriptional regulator